MKFRMPVNILKKNQKIMGPNKLKEQLGIWIGDLTPVDLGRMLDKCVREHDTEPKLIKVTGWFTVKISNCQGLENSSIMLALKYAMMPLPVQVYDFKRNDGTKGATGQFVVDNKLIANRMKRLNGKVSVLYGNQKIDIHVEPGLPASLTAVQEFRPQVELLAAVKSALHARHDRITQTLNLSRFHATTQLLAHFCPLHAVPAMRFLLEIIGQEFPQLRVLQLRDNFLCTLSGFQGLSHSNLPGLQVLDVGANHLSDPLDLKHLKNMNLKTLDITNNPLAKCQLGQLRNVLPEVLIIHNGRNNNRPEEEESILSMHGPTDFCLRFAQCYYKIFNDVDRRKELEMYYSDAATFSLNASQPQMETINDRSYSRFGLLDVMKAICQLPEIHVDVNDAKLEVQTFNSKLRMFTLSGSCNLPGGAGQTVSWKYRKYVRQFVMRSVEMSRWLITNDMLTFYSSGKEEKSTESGDFKSESKLDLQLEDLNNNMPKLTLQPEKSTQSVTTKSLIELPSFKEIPAQVPLSSIEIQTSLEQQVDETFLCSDDEVFLVINEEDLMDSVEL